MPYQGGADRWTRQLVDSLGGHIWTDTTDMAAGGAATAEATVESYRIPDKARTLLGWRPIDGGNDLAVAESCVAVFSLTGSNYNYQPQEVVAGTTADAILKDGEYQYGQSEYYDVFAPVGGGETLTVNVEPADAIAGNRRDGVEFSWTDIRLPLPVIYSQCSREVAVGAAAGRVAGTTLNINNAHRLIEVGGIVTKAAVTLEEDLNVSLEIACTALTPIQTLRCMFDPVTPYADLTTDFGSAHAYLARRPQLLNFTSDRASITATFDLDVVQSAAGQGVHYIRWI
jgi:hypothetical protein